jgi:K+-sensing histidine kinase KdpD
MRHTNALILKYILTAVVMLIFLTLLLSPSVSWITSLVIALFVTGISYAAGDLFILPRYGTTAATVSDFIMAAVIIWIASSFIARAIPAGTIIATAFFIGVAEWFFHRYLQGESVPEEQPSE